ncbi:hypothetical protein AVEN_269425-1 [Araneus ventricosus]|uniref:Integrase catalytic domain-containing protein n=1 Tax=Araneus ventricosus TaxID=182803 RepID=A0A4Y2R0Y9_ARAVE|nr:hypothetical protein AVEN_269425-1 [Araneus ventricosus]
MEQLKNTISPTMNNTNKGEESFGETWVAGRYRSLVMQNRSINLGANSYKLTKELSYEEIQKAEETLIRIIQSEWSSDKREKYTQTIQFYEENKILKVRSRLILGQDPENFVGPTVLADNPIVRRLIAYAHKTLHHAGVQTTLSHLRERFWIPRGRRVVKEVLQKCVTCRRYTSKPVVPVIPVPLSVDRINRVAAFEVTVADLANPIYLKGGEKAWIVIFMCAVYRAIHLELVTSLSTEAFMQAMRRFFAIKGRSSIMYMDNGTNFLGTSRALSNLNWQEIIDECAIQKIKWHFNIPAAPWYGGW